MLRSNWLWYMSAALVPIMSSLCQTQDAYPEGLCKFDRSILSLQAAWGIKFVSSASSSCANMLCLYYSLCARGALEPVLSEEEICPERA